MIDTIFVPIGYKKGDIVRDKQGKPYCIGEITISPIHKVYEISEENVKDMVKKGAKIIISSSK